MGKQRRQGPVAALSPLQGSSFISRDSCLPLRRDVGSVSRQCQSAQCLQPCCAGTKRRICTALWFSLNPCGLNLCWAVAALEGWRSQGGHCALLRSPHSSSGRLSPRARLVPQLPGNISRPCTERISSGSLCCCTETKGTLEGKNICSSFRRCSPFSLAGRGEGCHYFTDESGKSSVSAVSNAANTIIVGLNLEFGNTRQLWFWGRKKKIVVT